MARYETVSAHAIVDVFVEIQILGYVEITLATDAVERRFGERDLHSAECMRLRWLTILAAGPVTEEGQHRGVM